MGHRRHLALLGLSASFLASAAGPGCGRIDYDLEDDALDASAASSDAASTADGGMVLDGMVPDGDTTDSGSSSDGAAPDGGATPTCPAGALFCDGFETGFDPWDDVSLAAALVTSPVHSGAQSFASPLDDPRGDISEALPSSLTSGSLHLRSFVLIPVDLDVSSGQVLLELTEVVGAGATEKVSLNLRPSAALGLVVTTTTGANVDSAAGILPRGEWVCLELSVQIGAPGTVRASVNGVEALTTTAADALPPSGFGRAKLGASVGGAGVTGGPVAYFDDVVVDDAAIGCD